MSDYIVLESNLLNHDEIEQAIARGHSLRSEAAWTFFQAVSAKIKRLFHSNASDGSGLAHSA